MGIQEEKEQKYQLNKPFQLQSISSDLGWSVEGYVFTGWWDATHQCMITGDCATVTFDCDAVDLSAMWKKNIVSKFLVTSTSGNEYSYDPTSLPTPGSLIYVDSSGEVQKPFSDNTELSAFDSVWSVKDESLGISSIGQEAFDYCTSLSSIKCLNVQSIGQDAFYSCENLTSIKCPNVQSIEENAFADCSSLSTLEVSLTNDNFTLLDENNERKKKGIVLINENDKSVKWGSIPMCKNVVLPNDVTSIRDEAFDNCTNLTSIKCPKVQSIGYVAFYECSSLSSIECPNVKSIGNYAFYGCSKLTSIECPNVSSVGGYAFRSCTSLSSIECPNVTSIGDYAFYGCSKLSSVYITNMTQDKITTLGGTDAFGSAREWPVSVYVPLSCYDLILENNTWEALTTGTKPVIKLIKVS